MWSLLIRRQRPAIPKKMPFPSSYYDPFHSIPKCSPPLIHITRVLLTVDLRSQKWEPADDSLSCLAKEELQ